MKEVVPRVYIGDADDARRPNALVKAGITRVLTVHTDSFAEGFPETTTHNMLVQATDTEETDLLSRFQDCIDFIEAARQEEVKVLVHCNAGVSRSATVVMAFVMQKMQMDCPAAFRMIKGIHRPAMPNKGFVDQLKLFQRMGCKLDTEDPEYRMYRLQHLVDRVQVGAHASQEDVALAKDPHTAPVPGTVDIKCRKCRRLLARDTQLLRHEPGKGQVSFTWHRRDGTTKECTSLFLEPIEWMSEVADGLPSGKILCPKCAGRLGTFDWAGNQCSCGAWITPAFQIPRSRVDEAARASSTTVAHLVGTRRVVSCARPPLPPAAAPGIAEGARERFAEASTPAASATAPEQENAEVTAARDMDATGV